MSDLVQELSRQIVQTTSLFKKDDSFDDERFCRVRVAAMHTGRNRNGSRFSKSVVEKAKNTFKNIPVLADITGLTDEEGNVQYDYGTHGMHIEDDAFNKGKERTIYDEKIVGIVPETNNFELVYDEETKNYYAYVDAFLYRDYGNYACDILESRGGKTDVSMEISCDDVSFSTKDNCIDVGKMTAGAITLLGEKYSPGMVKANAQTFSMDEPDLQKQLIQIMQELKVALDNYTAASGNETERKEDTELKDQETKAFEETEQTESQSEEELDGAAEGETSEEETAETASEETSETEPEETGETEEEQSSEEQTFEDKKTISFDISHEDIRYALYNLIGQFNELDNDCYYINKVFDDKFIMTGWYSGNSYGCKYAKDGDNVELSGERYRLYVEYITESEKAELDSMRENYSSIKERLEKYEAAEEKAKKQELLASKDYSAIATSEEFHEIENSSETLTYDEVKEKCDELLLTYAKAGKITFAANDSENVRKTRSTKLPTAEHKKGRYGAIFSTKK